MDLCFDRMCLLQVVMQVDIKVHQLLVEVINKLRYPTIVLIVLVAIRDKDVVLEAGDYRGHNYRLFRNSSTSTPACFKIALKVPSGISPVWLGIVV